MSVRCSSQLFTSDLLLHTLLVSAVLYPQQKDLFTVNVDADHLKKNHTKQYEACTNRCAENSKLAKKKNSAEDNSSLLTLKYGDPAVILAVRLCGPCTKKPPTMDSTGESWYIDGKTKNEEC